MDHPEYLFKISVIADTQESIEIFAQDILFKPVALGKPYGVDLLSTEISINEHKNASLQLWLLSCEKRFKDIRRIQLKGSNGIMLIFNSIDPRSFDLVSEHITLVRNELPKVPFILIDLSNQQISKEFKETHNLSDSIIFNSGDDVKKIFFNFMRMITIVKDEVDEYFFRFVPGSYNSLRAARELTEELIKKKNSIKIGGDKYPSRRFAKNILILWFVLFTFFILFYIFYK